MHTVRSDGKHFFAVATLRRFSALGAHNAGLVISYRRRMPIFGPGISRHVCQGLRSDVLFVGDRKNWRRATGPTPRQKQRYQAEIAELKTEVKTFEQAF